jgi:hypothetical protein
VDHTSNAKTKWQAAHVWPTVSYFATCISTSTRHDFKILRQHRRRRKDQGKKFLTFRRKS